ncbi:aspartate--tRNA ligase [Candidatus Woesearchaeota archaeon]|nr:aspartate--tRNA ligase [Candidatus Woesearchaeota archaeon]
MHRTHTCGELRGNHEGIKVVLSGWVHSNRNHGGIIFIDLRDRYGITQLIVDSKHNKEIYFVAEKLRQESVIKIEGTVRSRGQLINKKIPTGEIEILVDKLTVITESEPIPLNIEEEVKATEDFRLKYRYVDLRRPPMQRNIMMRHKITKIVRDFFDKHGFLEIETPMLARSTPEGARDYLVPSRVNPGKFFALPQSPQLFKQLLMVSGFDRYMQIVKCFRDEDLRADRQPEFTQIDIEMSFVEEDDIYSIMEEMIKEIWKKVLDVELKTPFPRMSHEEAMSKYGSDKPDIRFGMELADVTDELKGSGFKVFADVIGSHGKIKCINAKGCAGFSRKETDELEDVVKIHGAKGLVALKVQDGLEGSVTKFLDERIQKALIEKAGAKKGDLLLIVADVKKKTVEESLGNLRVHLAKKLNLIDKSKWSFLWVNKFPLLEYSEEDKRYVAVHHPFTSPRDEDLKLLESEPEKARAKAYDITLNGVEVGGGSIRINDKELQSRMFKTLGIDDREAKLKFGFLLEAFKYGVPPHGGIAFGLDRMVALITGNESIREVIAFPKNKACVSLMDEAPNVVDEKQLRDLHIKSTGGEQK